MLPNLSSVLKAWERAVIIKTVVTTTTNFVPTDVVTVRTQNCVIQIPNKKDIKADNLDWALRYLMVHSKEALLIGEYVTFESEDFKITSLGKWLGYGYYEAIAEATNKTLLVETVDE